MIAEIPPSEIKKTNIGTFQDFVDDLQGAVVLVDPTPNIMVTAARLKDLPYQKPNAKPRRLSTPDAIILASAIDVREVQGVKLDFFHTFDDGKKRDPVHGKMVPLLSYQDWCAGFSAQHLALANQVISLNRCKPIHPSPTLPGVTNP